MYGRVLQNKREITELGPMKRKKDEEHTRLIKLIKECKISKSMISRGIQMPIPTFINKVDEKQPHYTFSQEEFRKIYIALLEYVEAIALRLPEDILSRSEILKPLKKI